MAVDETMRVERRARRQSRQAIARALRVRNLYDHAKPALQRMAALDLLGRKPRTARERRAVARYSRLRDTDREMRQQRRLTTKLRRYRGGD